MSDHFGPSWALAASAASRYSKWPNLQASPRAILPVTRSRHWPDRPLAYPPIRLSAAGNTSLPARTCAHSLTGATKHTHQHPSRPHTRARALKRGADTQTRTRARAHAHTHTHTQTRTHARRCTHAFAHAKPTPTPSAAAPVAAASLVRMGIHGAEKGTRGAGARPAKALQQITRAPDGQPLFTPSAAYRWMHPHQPKVTGRGIRPEGTLGTRLPKGVRVSWRETGGRACLAFSARVLFMSIALAYSLVSPSNAFRFACLMCANCVQTT